MLEVLFKNDFGEIGNEEWTYTYMYLEQQKQSQKLLRYCSFIKQYGVVVGEDGEQEDEFQDVLTYVSKYSHSFHFQND